VVLGKHHHHALNDPHHHHHHHGHHHHGHHHLHHPHHHHHLIKPISAGRPGCQGCPMQQGLGNGGGCQQMIGKGLPGMGCKRFERGMLLF